MPILKNLTFTSVPARSHDPVANRRTKLAERLEEQKKLLQNPTRRTSEPPSAGPARATSDARSRSSSASGPGGAPTPPAAS
jgi:hypothetical protein